MTTFLLNILNSHIPLLLLSCPNLLASFWKGESVPSDFFFGITTPIPKFKGFQKNATIGDFRGVTVNPVVSKIFENCLLPFFLNLTNSDRKFGFKKDLGCADS